MYVNADITLYNAYINQSRVTEYKVTTLRGVFWEATKGSNILRSGLSTADAYLILIPVNVDAGGKTYKSPKEWAATPNVDMVNFWTLQPGDKIVKGIINYPIPPGTPALLEKTYDFVTSISTVDVKDFGSQAMRHFRVGGA